jgi:hypothetical protein
MDTEAHESVGTEEEEEEEEEAQRQQQEPHPLERTTPPEIEPSASNPCPKASSSWQSIEQLDDTESLGGEEGDSEWPAAAVEVATLAATDGASFAPADAPAVPGGADEAKEEQQEQQPVEEEQLEVQDADASLAETAEATQPPSPLPAAPAPGPSTSPPPSPARAARPARDDRLAQSAAQRALLDSGAAAAPSLKAAVSDMRAKAARLELQLELAARAREAAEQRLEAAERQRREDAAFWEARLADRQREAALLQAKLRAVEAAARRGGDGGGGDGDGGGSDGGALLRASLSEGDAALMAAYQAENEAATRRIKVGGTGGEVARCWVGVEDERWSHIAPSFVAVDID